ncbi:MAG: flagellar biosynthesis protein FlgA, partial [Proteobacteria bacterium]|nr:flagellar biosynthesis protein FlgA [Pseudomonadota bacterium]
MNLHRMLQARAEAGRPVRVGLIGAGKFGAMFLAQARLTSGFHVMAVADLAPERARENLERTGWPAERIGAKTFAGALESGAMHITEDAAALIAAD